MSLTQRVQTAAFFADRKTGADFMKRRGGSPKRAGARLSNCTCGSPACSFHKGSFFRDAIDGINLIRFTNPYSPYSFSSGSVFQPVFRHRL